MGNIEEGEEEAGEEKEPKGGWWDIQVSQLRKECLERDIAEDGDKAGTALEIPLLISSLTSQAPPSSPLNSDHVQPHLTSPLTTNHL